MKYFPLFPDPCTDVSQPMRLWLPQSHASMTLTHAVPPSCGRFPALNGLLCFCVEIFCIIMSKIVGDQIRSQMLLNCKQTPQAFPLLHVKVLLDDQALHWVLSFQINIGYLQCASWNENTLASFTLRQSLHPHSTDSASLVFRIAFFVTVSDATFRAWVFAIAVKFYKYTKFKSCFWYFRTS